MAMAAMTLSLQTKIALAAINKKRKTEFSFLKPLQFKSVSAAYHNDAMIVLPTGYGKSLIFEVIMNMTKKKCIIISPLNAIILEQSKRLGSEAVIVDTSLISEIKKEITISWRKNTAEESFKQVMEPLLRSLCDDADNFPKTIVYSKLKWCGNGYNMMKKIIVDDMADVNGNISLLFATEAYGMGADAPNIRRIIHYGPPTSVETFDDLDVAEDDKEGTPSQLQTLLAAYFQLENDLVDMPKSEIFTGLSSELVPEIKQWTLNKGKCGLCGDPWDGTRENEAGGKYATGTIAGNYSAGNTMEVKLEITASHKGFHEFRICPVNSPSVRATQSCFDAHILHQPNGQTKFDEPGAVGTYAVTLVLPRDVSCTQCVLQWIWNTGNSYGCDQNNKCCIGCGPQEQFYGCADIAISPASGYSATDNVNHATSYHVQNFSCMLKFDNGSVAGSRSETIVMKTVKVRTIVTAYPTRSEESSGRRKTSTFAKLMRKTGTTRFIVMKSGLHPKLIV
ncbi:unnamed protein product [Mytilus edulis]|uniref:DNA 3'-5' helicase n=1 Tax=Mytilus edulis TaxID=6550 RepID=A0A8S3URD2_MYTED|nr:unnamed protein product [Mytilus edulis]